MFRKVDCIRIHVSNIDDALEFYQKNLGLSVVWRRAQHEAGLRMQDSDTELVLVTEGGEGIETDILVSSADKTSEEFRRLGGSTIVPPFDIAIGRCAVVQDPWKNEFVVLDMSKGRLKTDSTGNVIE